jgi:hypothetical protein
MAFHKWLSRAHPLLLVHAMTIARKVAPKMLTAGRTRPQPVQSLAREWQKIVRTHRDEGVRLEERRQELARRSEVAPSESLTAHVEMLDLFLTMNAQVTATARAAYEKVLEIELEERGSVASRVPSARAQWFSKIQRARAAYSELAAHYARLLASTETLSEATRPALEQAA